MWFATPYMTCTDLSSITLPALCTFSSSCLEHAVVVVVVEVVEVVGEVEVVVVVVVVEVEVEEVIEVEMEEVQHLVRTAVTAAPGASRLHTGVSRTSPEARTDTRFPVSPGVR